MEQSLDELIDTGKYTIQELSFMTDTTMYDIYTTKDYRPGSSVRKKYTYANKYNIELVKAMHDSNKFTKIQIAEFNCISIGSVYRILNGTIYIDGCGEIKRCARYLSSNKKARMKLTPELQIKVLKMRLAGMKYKEIMEATNLSSATVSRILNG